MEWTKGRGREWYDIDQLYLQYAWGKERGGGFSDVMIFDVYALPGKCLLDYVKIESSIKVLLSSKFFQI
jgi:hypothetical protein